MRVSEIMTPSPFTVSPDCTLQRAVELIRERGHRHLPVIDRGRLVGILSERDLLEATGWAPHRYFDSSDHSLKVVRDYMSVPVETAAEDDDVPSACQRLVGRRIGCLPVMVRGSLSGVLTIHDLLALHLRVCKGRRLSSELDPPLSGIAATKVITIESEGTVAQAIEICRAEGIRHLPVVYEGWFVGLVSDRDLLRSTGRGDADSRTIDEIMSKDLVSLPPDATLAAASERMIERNIHSVPVTSDKKLLGIVTSTDVLNRLISFDWDRGGRGASAAR